MYDFDIFSFDYSLAGLSAGTLMLAKLIFSSRNMHVECKKV